MSFAALLAVGTQPSAQAQTATSEVTEAAREFTIESLATPASLTSEGDAVMEAAQPMTAAAGFASPTVEAPIEIAQSRRRTRAAAGSPNFIGIGADFGYADDVSFAAISKFSFTNQWSIRPSVLVGDEFSILVPVTYDFSQVGSDLGGYQIRPYVGAGASYVSNDDDDDDNDNDDSDSELNLLLSAGVDVPISRRFTLNGQVNWGVLNDSQFGATVGVGYNFGN
ncbi:MAG: outer membrane beta-barrel protein [Cyanobacteria bacterium J06598_1]